MIQTKRVEPFWQDCGSTPGLFSSHQLHELATVAGVQRGLLSQQPLSLAGTLQLISTKATQKQMQLLKAGTWSLIPSTRSLNILSYFKVQWQNWKLWHYLISIVFSPVWVMCNEAHQWTVLMANIDHTVLLSSYIQVFLSRCALLDIASSVWQFRPIGVLKGIGSRFSIRS